MTVFLIIATFFTPESIGTSYGQLFWLIPLSVAGVVIYKAIKLPDITVGLFVREVFMLFLFLFCLLLIITMVLFALTALLT